MNGDTNLESSKKNPHVMVSENKGAFVMECKNGQMSPNHPSERNPCQNRILEGDQTEDAEQNRNSESNGSKSDEISSASANEDSLRCDAVDGTTIKVQDVSIDHCSIDERDAESLHKKETGSDQCCNTSNEMQSEIRREDLISETSSAKASQHSPENGSSRSGSKDISKAEDVDTNQEFSGETSVDQEDAGEGPSDEGKLMNEEDRPDSNLQNCDNTKDEESAMQVDEVDGRPTDESVIGQMAVDKEETMVSEIPEVTDNYHLDGTEDCDGGELRIEISDVRTIENEDEISESSDSLAIVDLEQAKHLSQDTTFSEEDISSPTNRNKRLRNNTDGTQDQFRSSAESQESCGDSLEACESVVSDSRGKETDDKSGRKVKEENVPKIQKDVDKEFGITSEPDMLQDLYNQTSSLHDPELSTMNTTAVDEEEATEPSPRPTLASDLLSNIAVTVKKIKSEPQDTGYENAVNTNIVKAQNSISSPLLEERLRLPVSFRQSVLSSEVSSRAESIPTFSSSQPPSGRPFVPIVGPTSESVPQMKTVSGGMTTNVIIQNNQAMQITTNASKPTMSTKERKTVAVLLPFTKTVNSSGQMYVSVPSLATSESNKQITVSMQPSPTVAVTQTVPVSTGTVKQNIILLKNVSVPKEKNDTVERKFGEDILNMCSKHNVKSIDLIKVTKFLQRKNGINSYRGHKPLDHFGMKNKSYSCLECGDSFALKFSLNNHLRRASMKITYFCSECKVERKFFNKCQLLSHMRKHADIPEPNKPTPPLKINSDLISIVTLPIEDLVEVYYDGKWPAHIKAPASTVNEEKRMVQCQICNVQFGNEDLLRIHYGFNDVICSFAYQCSICPLIMPRECALRAHMRLHSRQTPYVCPECGKGFSKYSLDAFYIHLKDDCFHTNRVCLLECQRCHVKLDGLAKIKDHLLKQHAKMYFKCKFCILAFDKKDAYDLHLINFHKARATAETIIYIHSCAVCKTLLNTRFLLEKHMDIHILELKKNAQFGYKCGDCKNEVALFTSRQKLFQHKQTSHLEASKMYRCNSCGIKVESYQSLCAHRIDVHIRLDQKKKVIYKCSTCNVTYFSSAALNKHVCTPPQPAQLLVGMCTRCKVILPSGQFVNHRCPVGKESKSTVWTQPTKVSVPAPFHLLSVQAKAQEESSKQGLPESSQPPVQTAMKINEDFNYKCINCNCFFATKESLRGHMYKCQVKLKNRLNMESHLSCNLCHVRFPTRKRLGIHIKEHSKKGSHVCPSCEVCAFENKVELKQHLLECVQVQSKEISTDNEICKICGKDMFWFEKVKHLGMHVISGLIICRHCQRMDFLSKSELDSHEIECGFNSHPLEHGNCYVCRRVFTTLDRLVVHLQDHVKEGLLVCSKCQRTGFKNEKELKDHHQTCGRLLVESMPGQVCSLCREAFPDKDITHLYRHLTAHVVKGVYICCKCQNMGWENHYEVKSHQIGCIEFDMNHKKEEPTDPDLQCTICHKTFFNCELFWKHVRLHRHHGSLICVRCLRTGWKDAATLSSHENECKVTPLFPESKETSEQPKKAFRKPKVTSEKPKIASGKPKVSSGQGYKTMDHFCEHCGKKYSKLSLLQEHMLEEHVNFPCHLCGLAYQSKSALVSHVNVVHDGKRSYFSCDICKSKQLSKSFASEAGLQKHMQKAHKHNRRSSGGTDLKDKEENVHALSSSTSEANAQKLTPPSPVKRLRVEGRDSFYTCAKCSFISDDSSKFAEHVKDHNTDKANQCLECGLCFTILMALKKHLFVVHKIRDSDKYLRDKGMKTEEEEFDSDSEELSPMIKRIKLMKEYSVEEEETPSGNPLECSVCHCEFPNEKDLKTHMRVHGMAFIRSRKRAGSRMTASSSPPLLESPSRSTSSISRSPSVDKGEKLKEENVESFPITTLREETMETEQLDPKKEDSISKDNVNEDFKNVTVKQEPMECDV